MMKRMALIVLALMLMVNFAQAESSFAAPADSWNFGSINDVAPTYVTGNALLGEFIEIYEGVTGKQFNRFGAALSKIEHKSLDYQVKEDGLYYEYEVGNNGKVVSVLYNSEDGRLEVHTIYPAGQPVINVVNREFPSIIGNGQLMEYLVCQRPAG